MTSLVKKIDAATTKNSRAGMRSFVVFLSDDESLEGKLKSFAAKEGITQTALAIDNPAGPRAYKIAKEADVTVIYYKNKKVAANHAFKKGELKAKEVDMLVSELSKIVPSK